jgi:hypothetical protein
MRSAAPYSTWYNGGLRTVTYFHNMTGILTEIVGSPTPWQLPLIASRQLPTGDEPFPVAPQLWHYKQSIDYEQTNNRAILDYASREREHLLYDAYVMGKNSIRRGSEDSWTVTPKRIEALEDAAAKEAPPAKTAEKPATPPAERRVGLDPALYGKVLHDPAQRDPRGYVLPSDQPDFPTAVKFVNALMKSGVTVERASAAFEAEGKKYPAGSLFVSCAQAYRPQVLDMFEPQDHPNDFAYPGAPPTRPYDTTGWTLAFQMGVKFDRMMTNITGPFEVISTDLAAPPAGVIAGLGKGKVAGFLVSHEYNDAFTLTNRLLKAGIPVYWLKQPVKVTDRELAAGALWIPNAKGALELVQTAAKQLSVNAYAVEKTPAGDALMLHAERVGLVDIYGGSMTSGWTRWLFEQFEFPFTVIYPQTLDAGKLHASFDELVFADGVLPNLSPAPAAATPAGDGPRYGAQPKPEAIPAEFRPWLGKITAEKTLPELNKFVADGGTILAIGSSARLYKAMNLPLSDAVTEVVKGKEQPVPPERFYIPGSLIRAQVDNTQPLAYGMPASLDVFFDSSPAFRAEPDAPRQGVQTIAWYGKGNLLDSGWAWGQAYLNDSIAVAQVNSGKGKVLLYGPEVAFRGQPHATFKFLFNGVLYGTATAVTLR